MKNNERLGEERLAAEGTHAQGAEDMRRRISEVFAKSIRQAIPAEDEEPEGDESGQELPDEG